MASRISERMVITLILSTYICVCICLFVCLVASASGHVHARATVSICDNNVVLILMQVALSGGVLFIAFGILSFLSTDET